MFKAITRKIEEQAKYIVLRDAAVAVMRSMQIPADRGRGRKNRNIESIRVSYPKGDPGDDMAYRWRKAFCAKNGAAIEIDFKKIRLVLEDAQLRAMNRERGSVYRVCARMIRREVALDAPRS